MATETLRPNAVGDSTQFAPMPPGGSDNYTYVDEEVADNATTYITASANGKLDLYNLPASAIGAGDTINSVTIYVTGISWAPPGGSSNMSICLKENATTTTGTSQIFPRLVWTTRNQTWNTRPSDSAAWTLTDINALQIGQKTSSIGTEERKVTRVYAVVDYTAGGNVKKINIGDAWKTIAGIQINIGDSWKVVSGMKINIGDAWKTIF